MSRSIVPPGKAGLILIFALATPIVLATCRPLTRRIGEEMKKIGEKLQEFADEGTDKPDAAPKADMKADRQTAASPAGKAEVEAAEATGIKGNATTEKPPGRAKRTAEVKTKPDQPVNPKRTGVTPAKAKAKPKAKKTPGV